MSSRSRPSITPPGERTPRGDGGGTGASAPVCSAAARLPASDCPILPTISGLPARSALSATRRNFSADLMSSISRRKTSVLPSSSMASTKSQTSMQASLPVVTMWRKEFLLAGPTIEERKAHAAPLGHATGDLAAPLAARQQRPRARLDRRAEGRTQRGREIGKAFRIGADQRHVVVPCDGDDLVLQARPLRRPALRRSRSSGYRPP